MLFVILFSVLLYVRNMLELKEENAWVCINHFIRKGLIFKVCNFYKYVLGQP